MRTVSLLRGLLYQPKQQVRNFQLYEHLYALVELELSFIFIFNDFKIQVRRTCMSFD